MSNYYKYTLFIIVDKSKEFKEQITGSLVNELFLKLK